MGPSSCAATRTASRVQLAGELRLPVQTTAPGATPAKLPAVIPRPRLGGPQRRQRPLGAGAGSAMGIAVFLLDSFSGRGIVSTVSDQSQLSTLGMMVDAYPRARGAVGPPAPRSQPDRGHGVLEGRGRGGLLGDRAVPQDVRRRRRVRRPHRSLHPVQRGPTATTTRSPGSRSGCSTASPMTTSRSPRAGATSSGSRRPAPMSRSPSTPTPSTPTTIRRCPPRSRSRRARPRATARCAKPTAARSPTRSRASRFDLKDPCVELGPSVGLQRRGPPGHGQGGQGAAGRDAQAGHLGTGADTTDRAARALASGFPRGPARIGAPAA